MEKESITPFWGQVCGVIIVMDKEKSHLKFRGVHVTNAMANVTKQRRKLFTYQHSTALCIRLNILTKIH